MSVVGCRLKPKGSNDRSDVDVPRPRLVGRSMLNRDNPVRSERADGDAADAATRLATEG